LEITCVSREYAEKVCLVFLVVFAGELVLDHLDELVEVCAALDESLAFGVEHLADVSVGCVDLFNEGNELDVFGQVVEGGCSEDSHESDAVADVGDQQSEVLEFEAVLGQRVLPTAR